MTIMMGLRGGVALAGAAALAGCATMTPGGSDADAVASLATADGSSRGTATLMGEGSAARLMVSLTGLTPGEHGVHLHSVGRCDAPAFESAGPHWNPAGAQHGSLNPAGPHAGDLGNVRVGSDGTARATLPLPRGADGLFDADGAAVMVHSGADDLRTDPGGDSGSRVACGVLRPG